MVKGILLYKLANLTANLQKFVMANGSTFKIVKRKLPRQLVVKLPLDT